MSKRKYELSTIHCNRWNQKYLCEVMQHFFYKNDNNWGYHSTEYIIAKIYLSIIITKLCIKRNNFGLPRELWDIICSFINNEIYFYLGREIIIFEYLNLKINLYSLNKQTINL